MYNYDNNNEEKNTLARLPVPGSDDGVWGDVLNEYLAAIHNADGTLKDNVVTNASLADDAVAASTLQDGSVPSTKLATSNNPTSGDLLGWNGSALTWTVPSSSSTPPDATSSTKGLVQLSGDLAGTAASPTVPGLASKADTIHTHTISQLTDLMAELRKTDATIFYSGGSYPLRSTATSDSLRRVRWVGPSAPTIGGGYAIDNLDIWEQA